MGGIAGSHDVNSRGSYTPSLVLDGSDDPYVTWTQWNRVGEGSVLANPVRSSSGEQWTEALEPGPRNGPVLASLGSSCSSNARTGLRSTPGMGRRDTPWASRSRHFRATRGWASGHSPWILADYRWWPGSSTPTTQSRVETAAGETWEKPRCMSGAFSKPR
jgi:hypothetical protein